jgi:trigger factor
MQVTQENIGALEAVIKVELQPEDYREKVEKELKSVQRKAQMPGFRPGKVPFGMVQKLYGKSVLVEEVNKVLVDAVYKHIKDEGLNILGHPVPDHGLAEKVDWDKESEYIFHYHIGLAPEIRLELNSEIEVDYYRIKAGDDIVDNYMNDLRRRYGKMTNPGVSEEEDVLYGEFAELESDEQLKPEGKVSKGNLYIKFLKDDEVKTRLTGAKPGGSVVMDVFKAVDSDSEVAAMIGVKKEEVIDLGPLFRFTIESISRIEPAELDAAFFEKVAPGKEIATEEALRGFIREQVSLQYQADVDKHFRNDVMKKLLEVTALPLPEAFLKKWLVDANRDEISPEQVEKEFGQFMDTFRWQLIENHLIKTYNLQISQEEVNSHLETYFRNQLKQYGQEDVGQEVVNQFVNNIKSKEDEIKKVYDHMNDEKLLNLFKEKLKLKETELGFDDFVKLVTEKYKTGQGSESPDGETTK